ncbi:putative ribonuclease H protein [Glycine soja]
MLLLLYRISDQQKQIIMNMGNNTNGEWEWKLSWRRALFDSEIQMADNFLGELSQQQIQPNTKDRCSWKHDQTRYYSTKSGYDLIWEAQMGANQNLDFVDIWKLKIPSKSLVFAWRLIRDRLPTRMNLRRRQCPFCGDVEEEPAHLEIWRQTLEHILISGTNMYINIKRKKIAWVSWTQCCASRDAGGLGIKDFRILNNSLLIKWKWYMFHQPEQLWNRILISKYQGWRGLDQGPQLPLFKNKILNRTVPQVLKIILSYNCRGLGRGIKWAAIKKLNLKYKVDLGDSNVSWDSVPSVHTSGGLLCLWNNSVFEVDSKVKGSNFLMLAAEVNWIYKATEFLNCRHMEIPFHYLGIPIGAKSTSSLVWESLIRKYEEKLSKWNQKILSMAGKVTLINYVLTALPIYTLSFFKLPRRIALKLVSLQRNFLWGGVQGHKKIPWVKWEVVCLSKEEGGLGVKDISKFNTALMGTWIWALSSNHNQLWVRILMSKYGGWSDLSSGRRHSKCHTYLRWKRRHELHKRQLDNVVAVTEAQPSLRQTRTQAEGETTIKPWVKTTNA